MITSDSHTERKRKPKVYGLHTFADPGCPVVFSGAFRDNIRLFLRECGDVEEYSVRGMPVWCTLLVDEKTGVVVPLYTIEECVRYSSRPFCDHCRCTGWSHHFVSKRRYHLIIPADDDWDKPLDPDGVDLHTHLLHGLIHCNGFGHLLCINGRDGGSKYVCGRDIMDLWDRICTALCTRQVTVEDVSRKRSMDLRLLLGVAHGLTWFGRWGYRLCLGTFGVTEGKYLKSIDLLSKLDLDGLIEEFKKIGREREIRRIVSTYRKMSELESPGAGARRLATLRDLLRYMLDFKNHKFTPPPTPVTFSVSYVAPAPKPARKPPAVAPSEKRKRCRDFEAVAAELESRWPVRRLRVAAQVIVDALKQQPGGMTRQEVRDAARLTIGDTGLLDFVIKSLGDCVVGEHVVRRNQNPSTRVLEFCLEDLAPGSSSGGGDAVTAPESVTAPHESDAVITPRELSTTVSTSTSRPSPVQVERDTAWVYKHVVLGSRPVVAEAVLRSKHWVKDWPLRDEEDDRLRFLCGWMPSEEEMTGGQLTRPMPPPEVLVMPPHAAVGELRREAEEAMRDTYCVMEGFRATRLEGVSGEEWDPLLVCGAESGAHVWVRGVGVNVVDRGEELRYEGGADNWTVDCSCGAQDDDGERMMACDICEVWQHTRCVGIGDGDAVPPLFLCERCGGTIMQQHVMMDDEGEACT